MVPTTCSTHHGTRIRACTIKRSITHRIFFTYFTAARDLDRVQARLVARDAAHPHETADLLVKGQALDGLLIFS